MSDALLVIALVACSALAVTAHLAIAAGLARRTSIGRALVALVAAPLAPWLAIRARMFARAGIWVAAVAGYIVARVVSY